MVGGIPAAEFPIEPELVRALLTDQQSDLASLPLTFAGDGWDNTLYRLGENLAVRLPRRAAAAPLIEHEQRWLPQFAPRLPLAIPVPLRVGRPGRGFPWSWSVIPWLAGDPATLAPPDDPTLAALELGAFAAALHRPAAEDAPINPWRGVPLADRTETALARLDQLEGTVDGTAVRGLWKRAVKAPRWSGSPLWIHGDLHPGNLLVDGGRISAVIDFGDLTAGDPATDLSIAWTLLPRAARLIFRESAGGTAGPIDHHTWLRSRGWALLFGLIFLATSGEDGPTAALGRATIEAVLTDD